MLWVKSKSQNTITVCSCRHPPPPHPASTPPFFTNNTKLELSGLIFSQDKKFRLLWLIQVSVSSCWTATLTICNLLIKFQGLHEQVGLKLGFILSSKFCFSLFTFCWIPPFIVLFLYLSDQFLGSKLFYKPLLLF